MVRRGTVGLHQLGPSLLLTVSALVIASSPTHAQGLASGAIAGVVKDSSGAVLPGVTVEAASPALIEKVRTVVSDDQGVFRVVDLVPGTYTVTFTLSGFGTLRREGIELSTGFTATVNAELKVGSLTETVTVSGAAPIVDTQNVNQQKVFGRELAEALPTARTVNQYIAMIPGAVYGQGGASSQDVGGNKGEDVQGFQIHGSRQDDYQQLRQGMFFGTMVAAGNRMTSVNPAFTEETTVQTSGASAESESGGALVNVINRDGGNTFRGSFSGDFGTSSLQSDNVTDSLRQRGFPTAPYIRERYDVGGGVGGPIMHDRLWFFASTRVWTTSDYYPGNYYNLNPHSLFYTPDPSQAAYGLTNYREISGRLTYQSTPRQKFSGFITNERNCNCLGGISAGTASPEASGDNPYWPSNKGQVTWNYVRTSKLLMEAGFVFVDGMWNRRAPLNNYGDRRVTDSTKNYTYGMTTGPGEQVFGQTNGQFTMSYVTGSHSFKSGFQYRSGKRKTLDLRGVINNWNLGLNELQKLSYDDPNFPIGDNLAYTFTGNTPQSITLFAGPLGDHMRIDTSAFFAQDQWTIKQLTVNLGLRFDYLNGYVYPVDLPAGSFVPARHFDELKDALNWKDLAPRIGAAYDLFGNGRTALKGFLGRYVNFEGFNSTGNPAILPARSPANLIVTSTTRTWSDANGNFAPDCDMLNPATNQECGPLANTTFGQVVRNTNYSDEVTQGFGHRGYNWQSSVQLQHELVPGIGINVGYFHTTYGNFRVTQNLAVTPADFTPYCINAPVDPNLPNGGGYQICGLYDVSVAKFGATDNLVKLAPAQRDVFNGVDVTVNARLPRGLILQGGLSTGSQRTDTCYANNDPTLTPQTASTTSTTPRTPEFCRVEPPWSAATQLKFLAVYPLPWQLQFSATYQNTSGIPTFATFVAPNSLIAPALGRNLAACGTRVPCNANVTIDLMPDKTYFQETRTQQFDMRFSRIFRWNTVRIQPQLDVFNLFNGDAIQAIVTRYGTTWRNATSVLGPRLVKFGVKMDF